MSRIRSRCLGLASLALAACGGDDTGSSGGGSPASSSSSATSTSSAGGSGGTSVSTASTSSVGGQGGQGGATASSVTSSVAESIASSTSTGAPTCEGAFGSYPPGCGDCLELACCAELAACKDNAGCAACIDDEADNDVACQASGSRFEALDACKKGSSCAAACEPQCTEAPCKLTSPQCGCGPDYSCQVLSGERACHPEGPRQEGASCDAERCAEGLACVSFGAGKACQRYCAADADCASPKSLCKTELLFDGKPAPGAVVCTLACDPLTSQGCPATQSCAVSTEGSGQKRSYTICRSTGAVGNGGACTQHADCVAGHQCSLESGKGKCRQICDVANPACASGTCQAGPTPQVVAGVTYGRCL